MLAASLRMTTVMVPKKGLEPPHPCGYMDLNHARLPIPPLRLKRGSGADGPATHAAVGTTVFYFQSGVGECQTWLLLLSFVAEEAWRRAAEGCGLRAPDGGSCERISAVRGGGRGDDVHVDD